MKFFEKDVQNTDGHRKKFFRKPNFRIHDKIEFFNKHFANKNGSYKETKVTIVRIMASSRTTGPRVVQEPPKDTKEQILEQIPEEIPEEILEEIPEQITKDVAQPPSPTCLREQLQFDAQMIDGEEKEADSSAGWNARLSGMVCSDSPDSLKEQVLGDLDQTKVTTRWEELREMMNTKMKNVHKIFDDLSELSAFPITAVEENRNEIDQMIGKIEEEEIVIFGDLGESAMNAVKKHRNEMNQMVVTFDTENSVVGDSVNWLWDAEVKTDDEYHGPMITCNDMKSYLSVTKVCHGEESVITPSPSL